MRKFAWAAATAVLLFSWRASATVTQVDGTILPVSAALQNGLNSSESGINAILHAAEVPEIFIPSMSQPVQFFDVAEGAGYENSFGWYNVGDDVVTPAGRAANLHRAMACNIEPGGSVTVDFAAERSAGRYKGGFIGFYLITPQDHPSSTNCGDLGTGADGLSLFGRIYYTQKDLNNDGDFVHHLVYTSPNTANRFYFGFEDLFRGGDNDFEDMLIRVTGLTPPCTPQAEVCDGIDNDCDGLVDGADPSVTGVGEACTCDGLGISCVGGPRFGQCQTGTTACVAAAIVCQSTVAPSAEVCDGRDNNCNNIIDDNPSGLGAACDGTDADVCPEGRIVCTAGALACDDNTGANVELCNNMDDDCDGRIDEDVTDVGMACGNDTGTCRPGVLVCQGGMPVCQGAIGPSPEVCDLQDNNCDGVIDNNPTDVGQQCGTSDTGACEFGATICVLGALACAGEVGPTPERCNGADDNCNGQVDDAPVDAGQPCGDSTGVCEPGQYVCQTGALVCAGGIGPTSEVCNNLDDDCDGQVDDSVPGVGDACGGMGSCSAGTQQCIMGTMQCVGSSTAGTEVCNAMDDDCDGQIDEGDLCNGGVCENGECALPCADGEFPCPPGKLCNANRFCVTDPCFGIVCPNDANGGKQECREGICKPLCDAVTCSQGQMCRPTDGACVPSTCDYLPICTADQLCINSQCVANKCAGVTCGANEFCRDGACIGSCANVYCKDGEVCTDGACVANGCGRTCPEGTVCDPAQRQCIADRCSGISCPPNHACDSLTGQCEPDACVGVSCPSGQSCKAGQCGLTNPADQLITVGGAGCNAVGGNNQGGAALLLGVMLLLGTARRSRHALLSLVAASALSSAGCNRNDYCINCALAPGDANPTSDGTLPTDARPDGQTAECAMGITRPETCNGADDDCDNTVDEGIDKQTDEKNCGACGVTCGRAGAQTQCNAGACTIVACFPGYFDRNGDIAQGYENSDGCEYQCFTSNGGQEACDGLDNNCNGQVDEGFDLQTDENNCGSCGTVCDLFSATTTCTTGMCGFNPATDCAAGFHDRDGVQSNGCEYSCTATNNSVEACDLRDNDCDGTVDNGFDVMTDVANCGRCGNICQFPHTVPRCSNGACGYNAATDCMPGFVDLNAMQLDGCEYACTPSNGGVEICDRIDNDCDGVVDDTPTGTGGACASTGQPMGACVANGTLVCVQGQIVCSGATTSTLETCDNVDQDCDGVTDDGVTRACYSGPVGTLGVGECRGGAEACMTGAFSGLCAGERTPVTESCNNKDEDCDGATDEGPAGGIMTQACYSGPSGTAGIGICRAGTQSCAAGTFGACSGEVVPTADVCGDTFDSDCDGQDDAAEGCLTASTDTRLDGTSGGASATAAGAQHSFDVEIAAGGSPVGKHVYVVWNDIVAGQADIFFRRSSDGGVTWSDIVNLTATFGSPAVKPLLAVAPGATDKVLIGFQSVSGGVRDIRTMRSTDSGATFSAPSATLDAAGDSFHHALAFSGDGSRAAIVWERLDTGTLNRDVISRVSTDAGATFAAELAVNAGSITATNRFAGRPQVAFNAAGDIIWVWREIRGTRGTRDIFFAKTASATTPPSADTRIDADTGDTRDSDYPQLAAAGNSLYVVWEDVSNQSGGGSDAMFARSTNGGTSFSVERVLDDPNAEVSSSFAPRLAIDPRTAAATDDVVAVAWEDRREGTQAYAAVSTDGGATFPAAKRVSSQTGDPIAGETRNVSIAHAGNGIIAVAYQNRLTAAATHVFVASSVNNGLTWTNTHFALDTGAGSALNPRATACMQSKPGALVVWSDFRSGTGVNGDIYSAVTQ